MSRSASIARASPAIVRRILGRVGPRPVYSPSEMRKFTTLRSGASLQSIADELRSRETMKEFPPPSTSTPSISAYGAAGIELTRSGFS
jgi:hypothetical protein